MSVKVCLLGDSVAKGVIYDSEKGRYVYAKDSAVSLLERDTDITVDNLASFGCTVTKGEAMLDKCGKDINGYDYTVLEFGGNDCDFDWASVSDDPDASHECRTPLELFREKYTAMIKKIKKLGGRPVILNLPPIDARRYFSWISRNLSPSRIMYFLKEVDYISRWQEMFSIAVSQIAAACAVPVIDIRSAFLSKPDFRNYLCEDGIHPNEQGQRLIYDAVRRQIPAIQ